MNFLFKKMSMKKIYQVIVLSLLILMSAGTHADILELNNGDVIKGSFISSSENSIVFFSESFGGLNVDKKKIKILKLNRPVTVEGKENCILQNYSKAGMSVKCGQDSYTLPIESLAGGINASDLKKIEPVWEHEGDLSVSGSIERGNSHKDEWDASLHYRTQRGIHRNRFLLEHENDINEVGDNDEQYLFSYNHDIFFTEKSFLNASLLWKKDDSDNISDEYRYGLGVGHQFLNKESHRLEIEIGYAYITQDFIDIDQKWGTGKDYDSITWALNWHKKPVEKMRLFHNHQLIQSLDKSSDYQLDTETGIRLFMAKTFYSEFKYEWDVKGEPLNGNGKEDETWTFGIGFEW